MKSKHITKILDKAIFAELSEHDKEIISAHISDCADCRSAFEAAHLSSVLLKVGSDVSAPSPSPFFQARVMNAWRELQIPRPNPIAVFRRWWQASAAPIFLILATMAVLISLTIFAPQSGGGDDSLAETSNFNLYSTENIVLNQKAPKDLTNEQVFQVIYSAKGNSRK